MNVLELSGLSYVKPISDYGNTKISIQANKFEEDLKLLLQTERGTMIGDPSFGSDLYKYTFEKNLNVTGSLIRDEIKRCIEEHFDFVIIKNIDVEFYEHNIITKIKYSLYVSDNEQIVELSFLKGE